MKDLDIICNIEINGTFVQACLSVPLHCPICGVAHRPSPEYATRFTSDIGELTQVFFNCANCGYTYCITYKGNYKEYEIPPTYVCTSKCSISPFQQIVDAFDPEIYKISPRAAEVYKQAQISEQSNLNELTGMGYRKTLEILLKDYLKLNKPSEAKKIENTALGNLINDIDDKCLHTLASRCSWLGNDHSHYLKKHEDKDLTHLKELLDGVISYIKLNLLVSKAEDIQPK